MPDWSPGKLADTLIPELIDRIRTPWVLHSVFWPSLALIAVPITLANGPIGALLVLATVLIVWRTSRVGLAGVSLVIWLPGAAFILFAALILGHIQARMDNRVNLTGWALVAFITFLVCVSSFSALLAALDRERRRKLLSQRTPHIEAMPEEPKAALRLAIMKLWIATMAMAALQAYFAMTVCMTALVWRRRWTAVLAGISSMLLVLVTLRGTRIIVETDLLEITVGLLAGYQWFRAAFQPWWHPRL